MFKISCAMVALVASVALASASENRCRITDPTGTPLNVRTAPNAAIVGTLDNGRLVYVIDHATDAHGKAWVYVGDSDSNTPIGWVFREFISCF